MKVAAQRKVTFLAQRIAGEQQARRIEPSHLAEAVLRAAQNGAVRFPRRPSGHGPHLSDTSRAMLLTAWQKDKTSKKQFLPDLAHVLAASADVDPEVRSSLQAVARTASKAVRRSPPPRETPPVSGPFAIAISLPGRFLTRRRKARWSPDWLCWYRDVQVFDLAPWARLSGWCLVGLGVGMFTHPLLGLVGPLAFEGIALGIGVPLGRWLIRRQFQVFDP